MRNSIYNHTNDNMLRQITSIIVYCMVVYLSALRLQRNLLKYKSGGTKYDSPTMHQRNAQERVKKNIKKLRTIIHLSTWTWLESKRDGKYYCCLCYQRLKIRDNGTIPSMHHIQLKGVRLDCSVTILLA